MVLPDIYSRRIKQERRAISPDVYQYDSIPSKLKVQIVRVFQDLMGIPVSDGSVVSETAWRSFHNFFCREKGFFKLEGRSLYSACIDYFLSDIETEDALDWIEIAILVAAWTHETYDEYDRRTEGITTKIDDGAEELNARFLDHDTGYQIANGKIIRIDRHFVHSEIVKPALIFLQEQDFQAANKEFMLAHKHYREQNYKDSVVAAHRAFESTLKAICAGLTIPFSGGDRASELIKSVRGGGLFPSYLSAGFDTFIALLKTGLPEVRNNAGGHGDAPGTPDVPPYIAAHAIHLTASNIVMLVEAYKVKIRKR